MQTISKVSELTNNMTKLHGYLTSKTKIRVDFARDLIGRGTCFVVPTIGGDYCFAPSRFVGYRNNTINSHHDNAGKHGA